MTYSKHLSQGNNVKSTNNRKPPRLPAARKPSYDVGSRDRVRSWLVIFLAIVVFIIWSANVAAAAAMLA